MVAFRPASGHSRVIEECHRLRQCSPHRPSWSAGHRSKCPFQEGHGPGAMLTSRAATVEHVVAAGGKPTVTRTRSAHVHPHGSAARASKRVRRECGHGTPPIARHLSLDFQQHSITGLQVELRHGVAASPSGLLQRQASAGNHVHEVMRIHGAG
jgi:hypothetical protein